MSFLGLKLSEEHKKKLSLSKIGILNPRFGKPGTMLGKKLSEERKKQISLSQKGKPKSEQGRININKGHLRGEKHPNWRGGKPNCIDCNKQLSRMDAIYCSKCHKNHYNKKENHWNWKGGISPEREIIRHSIEGRLWRNAVYARDNFTCQKTGYRGDNLECHHILNFSSNPELRFAIDNGITLSKKSHKEFHKIYGKNNNTKDQLIEYLTVVVNCTQ